MWDLLSTCRTRSDMGGLLVSLTAASGSDSAQSMLQQHQSHLLRCLQACLAEMNCLFFTTVFNVFTTDFHFFTTPPSILTTPPSILTTLLCSLRSEICCYLGLGRHAAHKIKISGDALTVSAPNICPSTTTVGTPYVRVICTGAASQSACPVVTAGI